MKFRSTRTIAQNSDILQWNLRNFFFRQLYLIYEYFMHITDKITIWWHVRWLLDFFSGFRNFNKPYTFRYLINQYNNRWDIIPIYQGWVYTQKKKWIFFFALRNFEDVDFSTIWLKSPVFANSWNGYMSLFWHIQHYFFWILSTCYGILNFKNS